MRQSLFLAGAALALAACSSTPPLSAPTTNTAPVPTVAAPATPAKPAPSPAPAAAAAALPAHLDPKSPVSQQRSVYFDFDSAVMRHADQPVVDIQGRYLASQPALHVRLEGNTDERGSTEYNLALGQRRAEALQKSLRVYGVKDAQMEAVSYGEEKPKATGHDEAAWKQNRRADVVYAGK